MTDPAQQRLSAPVRYVRVQDGMCVPKVATGTRYPSPAHCKVSFSFPLHVLLSRSQDLGMQWVAGCRFAEWGVDWYRAYSPDLAFRVALSVCVWGGGRFLCRQVTSGYLSCTRGVENHGPVI